MEAFGLLLDAEPGHAADFTIESNLADPGHESHQQVHPEDLVGPESDRVRRLALQTGLVLEEVLGVVGVAGQDAGVHVRQPDALHPYRHQDAFIRTRVRAQQAQTRAC